MTVVAKYPVHHVGVVDVGEHLVTPCTFGVQGLDITWEVGGRGAGSDEERVEGPSRGVIVGE